MNSGIPDTNWSRLARMDLERAKPLTFPEDDPRLLDFLRAALVSVEGTAGALLLRIRAEKEP